jgi:ABC-2 type transport system permease protein
MNIINRFFLKTALAPSFLYRRIGVNTAHLKSILTTKLIMDDRRPPALSQMRRRKKEKPVSMATIGTMLVSALFGLFYLLVFSIGQDVVTQLTFYFTIFFVMLSLTLISDFTSVLVDVRDNFIILPKPVSDRTFVVARLLHIFIHVCKIVLPMGLPALVMMIVLHGAGGGFLFFLLIFLLTAFSIFFINALYLLILKLTTPQRFQSIIGTIQIIFAIVMYGGYQIFPRMVTRVNFTDFTISTKAGIGFYPLYWLAQSWSVLHRLGGTAGEVVFAFMGFLFPLLCVFLVVKYLAPSFNRKLSLITTATASEPATKKTMVGKRKSYARFWSRLVTGSNAEKGSFEFTWKMTARSRDFKLKVYPSMGYLVVYVFIVLFGNKGFHFENTRENMGSNKILIVSALYFTSLLLSMAISQMVYSEKYKAGWIYFTSPLQSPGEVIAGAAKAVIVKFYLPIVMVIVVAGLFVAGPVILPNIIFGLFNQVLIAALLVYIGKKYFPFSMHQSNQAKTGSFLRGFSILIVSGFIAVGHFLLYTILPAVLLCSVLSIVASWLIFDSLKKTSWSRVMSRYADESV